MAESWPRVKLADCVELLAGFAFKSNQFTDRSDDIALVKGENVAQGRIEWGISKRWPAADWDKMAKYQLRPGDVVVAMDRPWIPAGLKWGFIRDSDPRALLVQRVARLRASNGQIDQNFLRFVIGSPGFEAYVRPITSGVNVPHISGRQILDFDFRLPPLPVQKRVAAILSAYDDLIENNQQRVQILEKMARALHFQRFQESASGQEGNFAAVATIERDSINPKDFPEEEFEHFSIPAFDIDKRPAVEAGQTILSNKTLIDASSVLVSKLNPRIPRVWLPQPSGRRRAVASSEFIVLKPRPPITREYLYLACSSTWFVKQFSSRAIGTSTSHQRVRPENLLALPCTVPDERAVAEFTKAVSPMLQLIGQLRRSIQCLRHMRDLMLGRLFAQGAQSPR